MFVFQFFQGQVPVGIDADIGGDFQRLLDNTAGIEFGVLQQRACRGLCIGPARADGGQIVFRLDDITGAR